MTVRIIPRLDFEVQDLVLEINLYGRRVLGKPEGPARKYDEPGADSFLYLDIGAGRPNERNK